MQKYAFILALFWSTLSIAQENSITGVSKLRTLINEGKINEAKSYLEKKLATFRNQKNPDSLVSYTEYVGSFSLNNKNWATALKNTNVFVEELLEYNIPKISKKAYRELAWVQSDAGRPDLAYQSIEKATVFAKKDTSGAPPNVEDMYYNLGYYAAEKGDYTLAKKNYLKSKESYEKNDEEKDYVSLQQVNNALGGIMWREAKMDSCNYYFAQSLDALKKTEPTIKNKHFRPGLVLMNMAVVSNAIGKSSEAILFSERAVTHFQKYIQLEEDEQQINAARGNLFIATDNLGVFYNAIGEFNKAEQLITYSYNQKKKVKDSLDPDVIISEIILAQAKLNTRDLTGAKNILNNTLKKIEKNPGVQDFWKASAFSTNGKVLIALNENTDAGFYLEEGIKNLFKASNNNYNLEVLDGLSEICVFYAKTGQKEKALERSKELYTQATKGQFKNTAQGLLFLLAVAETHFQLEDFEASQKYSQEVISIVKDDNLTSNQTKDAVLKSFQLPRALLLNAKSKYNLKKNNDVAFLNNLLADVEKALQTLQVRQTILQNYDDLQILVSQNKELIDFAKQLQIELYDLTGDEGHLEKLISYHESSIYNKIRARLNLRDIKQFANVPNSVIEKENKLKKDILKSLENNSGNSITNFVDASKKWEIYREKLKTDYPNYFNLKYGSILQQSNSWRNNIPKNATIVRYIFVEDTLYSLTINNNSITLNRHENQKDLEQLIQVQQKSFLEEKTNTSNLKELYDLLWQPLEKNITTEKVIILPDGILFNLSFETLTKNAIKTFKELKNESLLAKHSISYHFSLYLLGNTQTFNTKEEFIAFAPSFEQKMKDTYLAAVSDSTAIDKSYLTLLPQPFIKDVAQKYGRIFKGKVYLNENASKALFLQKAGEHKIIHIGTHAESNNLSPELSRLIFAKTIANDSVSGNSLYAYEIYNSSLASELAILTACETGKTSYQPGEGMISLTHAFTYAGSNSILTSLWKVDEKSSAEIVATFLDKLSSGLSKDQALRQAKLEYLDEANGRVLAPQYWAGLVLIGDTTPIDLNVKTKFPFWLYAFIGFVFLIILILLLRRNK